MKKILALAALLASIMPAIAADNIPVTAGAGTPIRSTDTSAGATGAGPYVNWYTLSTSGAAGTAPVVLYGTAGVPAANPLTVQGIASMTPILATVTGTVTANQGGTWNITNISGTVSLPTGASTSALQPTNAAIASTTAAQTGHLVMGAVTTAAPTYTTAQTNPLSLDTTGALRVNVTAGGGAGGTSSTYGSAFPATGTAIGASDGTNMQALRVTTYGTAPTGLNAVAVNANVTNAAPPGRTANGLSAALASPVVQPSAPNSGATAFPIFSTGATTVGVSIKTSAAVVFGCQLANTSTTLAFVKIYNKASAATVGTDTPVKTLIVPGPAAGGGGSNILFGPGGFALSTGFSIGITGLAVNSDTTAVASNNVVVNCDYE